MNPPPQRAKSEPHVGQLLTYDAPGKGRAQFSVCVTMAGAGLGKGLASIAMINGPVTVVPSGRGVGALIREKV